MFKPTLVCLIALSMVAIPAAAQIAPSPFEARKVDSAQVAARVANSQRAMRPASFVLGHKDELRLTPEQIKQIDLLARAEEDSVLVRQIRATAAMTRLMKKRQENTPAPQTGWIGIVNEKQLRDEACEQAGMQIDVMVNLMRDRQAVGNILTMTQIDRILEIEASDMLRLLKPKEP